MKQKYLLILILAGCGLQNINSQQINTNNRRKFNISLFNQNKNEYNVSKYRSEDDSVEAFVTDDCYQERRTKLNTPFSTLYLYYKDTGNLMLEVGYIYSFESGIEKKYNESGVLIQETDMDAPYQFTFESLVKLIADKFNVNIMNPRIAEVARGGGSYSVFLNKGMVHDIIYVNGNTGEIFYYKDEDGKILIDKRTPEQIQF